MIEPLASVENERFKLSLVRYSDPKREYLAHAAAVYLGKPDRDNINRPLGIIKKHDTLAIYRGEHARFEYTATKVAYDHLTTYTTANLRACGGLRANVATTFVPPLGDDDPIYNILGEAHLHDYKVLIDGIDPETEEPGEKKRLQNARAIAPMSVQLNFIFEFNLCTLIESIFPQRIWAPGAQEDTKELVLAMWDMVHVQDPELWDLIKEYYGPEQIAWERMRMKIKNKDPELYAKIMKEYGGMKSMWDNK